MEFEGGNGPVAPTACYSAEKFLDNKKHSRGQKEMKMTDEVALQTQTWFLTAFVEKTREQLNRNISPEAALGLKCSGLSISV